MLITTIGSSSGCSTSLRDSAGVYIQSSKNILLDCGEATNKFFLNRDVNEIDVVCITHAHLDHFIGLPMLLFHNLAIRNRTKPITIIMPETVWTFIEPFMDSYHLRMPFKYKCYIFKDNQAPHQWVFDDMIITGYNVRHSMDSCYGYNVYDKSCNKNIVYTGDTEPFDSLSMLCDDTDLVIAEGTWASDYTGPRYGHSWVTEMIEAVDKSSANKLVLTHLSQKYHSEDGYMIYSSDVMDAFQKCENLKRIYIAYDGMEIKI